MAWDENSYPGYRREVHEYPGASTYVEYVPDGHMTKNAVDPTEGHGTHRINLLQLLIQIVAMAGFARP